MVRAVALQFSKTEILQGTRFESRLGHVSMMVIIRVAAWYFAPSFKLMLCLSLYLVTLTYPYCLPPMSGGQAGKKDLKEGAKYAAKKYLPPPSKLSGITFHFLLVFHDKVFPMVFGDTAPNLKIFLLLKIMAKANKTPHRKKLPCLCLLKNNFKGQFINY